MIKSKKLFIFILILIAAAFAVTKTGNQGRWTEILSDQARQSKTSWSSALGRRIGTTPPRSRDTFRASGVDSTGGLSA